MKKWWSLSAVLLFVACPLEETPNGQREGEVEAEGEGEGGGDGEGEEGEAEIGENGCPIPGAGGGEGEGEGELVCEADEVAGGGFRPRCVRSFQHAPRTFDPNAVVTDVAEDIVVVPAGQTRVLRIPADGEALCLDGVRIGAVALDGPLDGEIDDIVVLTLEHLQVEGTLILRRRDNRIPVLAVFGDAILGPNGVIDASATVSDPGPGFSYEGSGQAGEGHIDGPADGGGGGGGGGSHLIAGTAGEDAPLLGAAGGAAGTVRAASFRGGSLGGEGGFGQFFGEPDPEEGGTATFVQLGGAGGGGGGAVLLEVAGELRIHGTIRADGFDGESLNPQPPFAGGAGGGGGSGGTILLSAQTLFIGDEAVFSVEGGIGGDPGDGGGRGGDGAPGRVEMCARFAARSVPECN